MNEIRKNKIRNWNQFADSLLINLNKYGSLTIKQIECGITRTNTDTHKIISDNITSSPVYSGSIQGSGPRYCPSIEDKVNRFYDKNSHQIFLEPE